MKTLLFVLLFAIYSYSADKFINCNCPNNGDGTSWSCAGSPGGSGAFNDIPTSAHTWVRGITYWLGGSGDTNHYHGTTFTNETGSGQILLKKASILEHGTDNGWIDSLGTMRANISEIISFEQSNVVIDGSYRSTLTSGYGIKSFIGTNYGNFTVYHPGTGIGNLSFKFIEITSYPVVDGGTAFYLLGKGCDTISNCYIHHISQISIELICDSNVVIENNVIGENGIFGPPGHSEMIFNGSAHVKNVIIRNNIFRNYQSTGCISLNTNDSNWIIYNNIFFQDTSHVSVGNGVINGHSASSGLFNITILNNAFINLSSSASVMTISPDGSHVKSKVINNIFYNCSGFSGIGSNVRNNNWYFGCPNFTPGAETGKQTGTGNPFVDTASKNFHTKTGTTTIINQGTQLNSYFTTDKDGIIRGSVWDIGPYEYINTNSRNCIITIIR